MRIFFHSLQNIFFLSFFFLSSKISCKTLGLINTLWWQDWQSDDNWRLNWVCLYANRSNFSCCCDAHVSAFPRRGTAAYQQHHSRPGIWSPPHQTQAALGWLTVVFSERGGISLTNCCCLSYQLGVGLTKPSKHLCHHWKRIIHLYCPRPQTWDGWMPHGTALS